MKQNKLFVNFDRVLSKSSLRYVKDMYKLVKEYENFDLDNNEKMLKHFNDNKYPHAILFHSPDMHSVINMTIGYSESGDSIHSHQQYTSMDKEENDQCEDYVQPRGSGYNLTSDQTLMMAFTWIHPQERGMFIKFSSVIYKDSTMDTNNEMRPLLLMVGKDTNSKIFTLLRAHLPNQTNWIFPMGILSVTSIHI